MTEELVERVVEGLRTMPRRVGGYADHADIVRAIIPIVLEEAAKVAEQLHRTDELGEFFRGRDVAQAIRSLSSPILTEEG